MSELSETIRENLKRLRNKARIDQKTAAELFGVSYSSYQKYEINKCVQPTLGVLIRIADYYAVPLDELVSRTVPGEPKYVPEYTFFDKLKEAYDALPHEERPIVDKMLQEAYERWKNSGIDRDAAAIAEQEERRED